MFCNLHVHSAFSLLDSILTVEQIVNYAKEHGQKAIAITDHGYMHGFVQQVKLCKKHGVKPIIGCEIYEVNDDTLAAKQDRNHLVLLAKNATGLRNLYKIVSFAATDGFYTKPRISIERIANNNWGDGIICLTACQAGRLSRLVTSYDMYNANKWAEKLQSTFDYVAVEIQSHDTQEQYESNYRLIEFANRKGLPLVVTSDAHYLSPEDISAHSIFVKIGQDRDVGESYEGCYLQDENDIYENLKNFEAKCIDKAINESVHIADMIEDIDIGLENENQMPVINIPAGYSSHEEYLKYLIYSTFDEKFGHMSKEQQQERKDRIETELPVIEALGYVDYFLMCYMLLNEARARGIPLGYARGSAAGCLCLYLLNVTQIDSVLWDLDFSRFANLGRRSLADIDIDISKRRRREVIDIAVELFGKENVAPIATFNTLSTKVAIRDIGKVLHEDPTSPYYGLIPYQTRNEVASAIPTVKTLDDLGEEQEKDALLKDLVSKNKKLQKVYEEFPLWFEYVMRLEGLCKSKGKHAAGVLITPMPIVHYAPVCLDTDKNIMSQLEMHSAMDDLKLVKMDFLGLKTLDVVDDALKNAHLTWQDVDINRLNFADRKVYDEVYKSGNTVGIFQMESLEAKKMCMDAQANNIDDIIAVNAANRPGTKDSFPEYCKNKINPEDAVVIHDDLKVIFGKTHYILLYQEQALAMFRYAGFPETEVDNARRAIGKKQVDVMAALEEQFRSGLLKLDWTHPQINEMWALILKQSGYSFNKCVSGDTKLLKYPNLTVDDMYMIKNDPAYARQKGKLTLYEKFNSKEGYGYALSMHGDNIITNRIVDIYYSGERNVLCFTTVSGKQIKCTANHKFPTPKGEKLASALTVRDSFYVAVYTTNGYVPTVEKIASIEDMGIKSVYDIEMADPAHNFVIDNGIVTSNSHACAYGLLSYLTAYLKTHYPVEFMSACLTADSGNVSKLGLLINECKRMGIKVLPPNINKSGLNFTPIPEKNTILFGLLAIKGLGETTIQKIIEHRPFTKFSDYLKLVKDKTATIALIKSGAFGTKDKMGLMRKYAEYLLEPKEYKPVLSTCNKAELLLRWGINSDDYKTGRKVDKESLLRDYNHVRKIKFDEEEAVRQRKFLNDFRDKYACDEWLWEFQSLSMFITSDPFEFAWGHITAYEEINNESDAVLVGIIVETQRKKDSKGNLYFFVKLYTPSGIVEIICWSSTTRQYLDLIAKGKCVAVYGRKTEGGNLIAEELKEYSEWLKDRNIVHHGVND